MIDFNEQELKSLDDVILKFMSKPEIQSNISNMTKNNEHRLVVDLNKMREEQPDLVIALTKNPIQISPIFEKHLNDMARDLKGEKAQAKDKTILGQKQLPYRISFEGMMGKNLVSPRGLTSKLTNQFVGVQGIVTRISIVRPKLVFSTHYCEQTKQGRTKEYFDQYSIQNQSENLLLANIQGKAAANYLSNTVPTKDEFQNPLSFEYGFSQFKDFQVLLVQEPPERTPVGQLPRSVEVILEEDLVDRVKPGDRIQASGIFKCISSQSTNNSGVVRTVLIAMNIQSLNTEIDKPNLTGEDIRNINALSKKEDVFNILANSLSPGIYGHSCIKRALILQLLGGSEKNLENGTHLRGDINVLLIGDPSTAKSQFLRHMISISPNAITTTGRGSSGVGLTAAVVVDPDTGERHLEAGAMVLGDRGMVCIDEFDKMSEVDRVAIHEVMEQQTVTIAKAGIHVSLNARCSVLAAANPIYGQYLTDLPASRNIGFPDSLLSRFDLCFVVLDEHNPELDRKISERVINNHMYTLDIPSILTNTDDRVIEPDIRSEERHKAQMYEKYNPHLHGKEKKEILTREFLRKYLYYAKTINPELSEKAIELISKSWATIREKSKDDFWGSKYQVVPITVRTLETLIRLSTAYAKARLSKTVELCDAKQAFELLTFALYNETEGGSIVDMEVDDDEEEEEKPKEKSKPAKQSKRKIEEEPEDDEEEASEEAKKKSKGKKKKKAEPEPSDEIEALDELLRAQPKEKKETYSKEIRNFVFKTIYDNAHKKENQTISIENLWNIIKEKPESKKTHKITTRSTLLEIVFKLEEDEKIFVEEKTHEITLI